MGPKANQDHVFVVAPGITSPRIAHSSTQQCYQWDKVGHLASCCLTKPDKPLNQFTKHVNMLEPVGKPPEYCLHSIEAKSTLKPIRVTFTVKGLFLEMELDSGSPVSLISENTYQCHLSTLPRLTETDVMLKRIR